MGKHAKSVDSQLVGRTTAQGRGWVFTPADFLDLGIRIAVGLALMRHVRAGTIRQLARGLYDYPVQNPRFGLVPPSDEAIANALKGRDDARNLTFKGGPSLSKCWKLIERFSEDIDVVIDRGFLGFGSKRSPEATTGSNERRRRLEALKAAAQNHIYESLAPALERRQRANLPDESSWTVTNDSDDPDGQTLIFAYPSVFPASDYLRPAVKIEGIVLLNG